MTAYLVGKRLSGVSNFAGYRPIQFGGTVARLILEACDDAQES